MNANDLRFDLPAVPVTATWTSTDNPMCNVTGNIGSMGSMGGISDGITWYQTPNALPPPQTCSGDVHVFPCRHCAKCKCGRAMVKKQK